MKTKEAVLRKAGNIANGIRKGMFVRDAQYDQHSRRWVVPVFVLGVVESVGALEFDSQGILKKSLVRYIVDIVAEISACP